MKVVFVCSGNICRSPMAAAYFRQRTALAGLAGVGVDSGGTLGIEGSQASEEAILAMREVGVDLEGHRSQALDRRMLADATFTLGMTWDHLDFMAHRFPEGADRRLLLRAFEKGPFIDPNPRPLADPIGRPLEFYRELVPLIVRCVDHLVAHLQAPR